MFSIATMTGDVKFPTFQGERVYMQKFFKKTGLPAYLKRWQDTVDAMLEGVDTDNPIFIMIDQKKVMPHQAHRRPGAHIDGYWRESLNSHRCTGGHIMQVSGWDGGRGGWSTDKALTEPEAIILASNYSSCVGYVGEWESVVGEGGDLSHLPLDNMDKIELLPNKTYVGNVGFIHESIPVKEAVERTLVRLNVKEWELQ